MTHPEGPAADDGTTDDGATDDRTPEAALADVRAALAAGGAPDRLAERAVAALGPGAARMLREDPWQLLAVPGLEPRQADLFARGALGGASPADPRRVAALVQWTLLRAAGEGHTAVEAARVVAALERHQVPGAAAALRTLVDEGRVMAFAEEGPEEFADDAGDGLPETDDGLGAFGDEASREPAPVLLALDRYALAEEAVADGVLRLISTAEPMEALDRFARARAGDDVADLDTAGLARALAGTAIALYVSGPGEDPPVAPLRVAAAAAEAGLRVCAATPAEDGARRTAPPPGVPVTTLRRLLTGADPQVAAPGPDGSLALDLIVVTEAHLLDAEAVAALVEAAAEGTRLVLSGDPGEVGPEGPGRPFGDLLDCGRLPVILSGSAAAGELGQLAAAIREGELPPAGSADRQVVLVRAGSAEEAAHRAAQLVGDSIPRVLGIPADDVLVVTTGHDGPSGTGALNAALKARLNPGPGRFGGFDIGDRVVRVPAVRGIGLVTGVITEALEDGLRIGFTAGPEGAGDAVVPRGRLHELRHGWAVTVRQAAGVRRAGAVAVVTGDPGLSRPVLYTAFTRGTRHLSVVHTDGSSAQAAVRDRPGVPRTTRLVEALRSALDG